MARKINLEIGTGTGAAADPIARAAGLHYGNRANMIPCYVCGMPHHRDRGRNPSGTVRRGVPTVGGNPVCDACTAMATAKDAAGLAAAARVREATAARVAALWAEREARENA